MKKRMNQMLIMGVVATMVALSFTSCGKFSKEKKALTGLEKGYSWMTKDAVTLNGYEVDCLTFYRFESNGKFTEHRAYLDDETPVLESFIQGKWSLQDTGKTYKGKYTISRATLNFEGYDLNTLKTAANPEFAIDASDFASIAEYYESENAAIKSHKSSNETYGYNGIGVDEDGDITSGGEVLFVKSDIAINESIFE